MTFPLISKACSRLVIALIRGYQLLVSPWLGPQCRHMPTCSAYAVEAIRRFGVARGGWLAARRVAHCHPWGGSGYDPVPEGAERGDSHPGTHEAGERIER